MWKLIMCADQHPSLKATSALTMMGVERDTLGKWRNYERGEGDKRKPNAAKVIHGLSTKLTQPRGGDIALVWV